MEQKTPSFYKGEMPEGVSLLLFNKDGEVVFENNGKWLHPLLDLGENLADISESPSDLFLHDKIAGLAAAALIARIGIRICHIDIVSRLALERFEQYGVECSCNEVVDRIDCRTESILSPEMDNDQIYAVIRERAGRSL